MNNNSLDYIIDLPGFFFVKDLNSNFITMSKCLSERLGWKKKEQYRGKTDYDIPSPTSEVAEEFIKVDKKILQLKTDIQTLDIVKGREGNKILLARKHLIKDELGNITSIFYHGLDITNTNLFPWLHEMNHLNQNYSKEILKPGSYILNPECSPLPLSHKQQVCVFLLIRGKIAKEIAEILGISVRTVEGHLAAIKYKLKCCSKSQIIEIAINKGFLYYIPPALLNGITNRDLG